MVVNAKVSLRQRRTKLDDLLTYDGPLADSDQEEFVALMESEAVSSRILKPPSDVLYVACCAWSVSHERSFNVMLIIL